MSNSRNNKVSKKQEQQNARKLRATRAKRKKQMANITLIVLGAAILVLALAWPSIKPVTGLTMPERRNHPMAEFNSVGDPEAPVKIEVFSDYACINCYDFFNETEQQLVRDYVESGTVYFVYRSFGPVTLSSGRAAEASYCAGDQGMFWEMHDYIFTNYEYGRTNGFSVNALNTMAEDLGLDTAAFRACLDDGTYTDTVLQDQIDGINYGVKGTPNFVVNGVLAVPGNQPYSDFVAAIEDALASINN